MKLILGLLWLFWFKLISLKIIHPQKNIIYINISVVERLITIERIQINIFILHNTCIYIYIYIYV